MYSTIDKPSNIEFDLLDGLIDICSDYFSFPRHIELEFVFIEDMEICGDVYVDGNIAIIEIYKKMSKEELIKTIFHEICHVYQIITGKLILGVGNDATTWYGEKMENVDYDKLPWEIEATKAERDLYNIFHKKCSLGFTS